MRRILAIALMLSLLGPTSSIGAEEKKTSSQGNSNSNSQSGGKGSSSSTNNNSDKAPLPADSKSNNPNQSNNSSSNSTDNSSTPQSSNKEVGKDPDKGNSDKASENSQRPESTKREAASGSTEETQKSYVIKLRDDASVASEASAIRRQNGKVSRSFNAVFKGLAVTVNSKQFEALLKNPRIELIEEDIAVRTADVQQNPTWGLDRIDQKALPLDLTYTYSTSGSNVKAYVIDTGIKASHQEFGGRVIAGYSSINDGRGTDDCNGHGTHVAGTIAGANFGVTRTSILVPVRVLGCDGSGTLSGVVAGLDWIAANHTAGTPAVANMSLGSAASSTVDSAVNSLINRGVTVVVAAGNSSASACNYSPARVPAAITVAASTSNDQLANYSNFGNCVDIIAPGSAITSAWISSDASTATLNGTSMASPHVAGAAVGILANGFLSPATVDSQIKSVATSTIFSGLPNGTPNLLLFTNPGGVINPQPVFTVPGAPTNVFAKAIKRGAELSWQLPSDNGGTPLTSQVISIYNGAKLLSTLSVSSSATMTTIRSLNPKITYAFTVTALNNVGAGSASSVSNFIVPLR